MFCSRNLVIPALFLGILAGRICWDSFQRPEPVIEDTVLSQEPVDEDQSLRESHKEIQRRAQLHLDWAQQESEKIIAEHLQRVGEFFAEARKNTPAFADDVLGWGSKWRLITDHLPLIGTDGAHEKYLADRFVRHLFSSEQLEKLLARVLAGVADDLQGMEAELLVRIRADVETIVSVPGSAAWNPQTLEIRFKDAMEQARRASHLELRDEALKLLVSTVITETLVAVATRLGISGGLLGIGAVGSGPSLGTTLLIGLIVDQLVGWVYDYFADPHGHLVHTLNSWLDDLHRTLVDGTPESPGLRAQLQRMLQERDSRRRANISEILQGKDGSP